ncbi:MAG: B12-binding domain-containing protein [Ectothiorhodospira sp.]
MVTARRQIAREEGKSSPGQGGGQVSSGILRARGDGHSAVSGAGAVEDCTDRMRRELSRVIEGEIIPRLMLAHRPDGGGGQQAPGEPPGEGEAAVTPETVQAFARTILEQDSRAAGAFVSGLRCQGVALETLLVHLLAPAARRLGAFWDEDHADFTQVTVGLCRLQHVLRELSLEMDPATPGATDRRVLLAPVPGEQHTFGLMMVAEFFRREGWDVRCDPAASLRDLNRMVRQEPFDVLALSLSCDVMQERLRAAIRGVRRASRNADLRIMVGGRVFIDNPHLAGQMGADATARDAREAVQVAEQLVSVRAGASTGESG